MSISDNYVPIRQIGNGITTQFSASWNMLASAYAQVFLEDAVTGIQTAVTEGPGASQFTFVSLTASGFTIQFNTAPTSAYYVVVGRNVTLDQTDPYRTSKGFQGDKIEASYDKLTAICQDTKELVGRQFYVPIGDTATSLQVPNAAARALGFFAFDASGNPIVAVGAASVPVSAAMAPVVSAITVAAARTLLGAAASGANSDITSLSALASINGGQIGGLRNKIINGDFRFWDYSMAYTTISTASYGAANRWFSQSSASATEHFNQDTSITAGLGFKFNAKMGRNVGGVNTSLIILGQVLESVNSIPLAGQVVTLSYYAKKGANYSAAGSILTTALYTGTGADQSSQNMVNGAWTGQVQAINANDVLTTSWQRFQHSITLASNATQIGMEFVMTPSGTAGADDNYYIAGVQLEIGSVATPFEDRGAQVEKALCKRYLPAFSSAAVTPLGGGGVWSSGTNMFAEIPFDVETRIPPTGITISGAGHFQGRSSGVLVSFTNVFFNVASKHTMELTCTSAAGGTAGQAGQLFFNNANASIIGTGVEL